jgi:molybdenum cofactor cytidylyltransferase
MKVAAVLLAAGRGSRFGGAKLAAQLGGQPLGRIAAATLAGVPFAARIAVVSPQTPDLAGQGFASVLLEPAGAPLSRSIALGVARARAALASVGGADAVLLALADMPFVPAAHVRALLGSFDGHCLATRVDGRPMPPALFGPALWPALCALHGDSGARHLIAAAPWLDLPADQGLDIDTPEDLARAALLHGGAEAET